MVVVHRRLFPLEAIVIDLYLDLEGKAPDGLLAKVIAKVQQFILANLDRKLQLSEVSSVFGFSQNYLSSLFSRYGGCSFVKYTTNAKINMAKEMIASGDYKIYEISEKLGFESSFYFSKVFKKAVGCSPREYMQRQPQKREKR